MVFRDKTILITGGTGSLGKTLVDRILTGRNGTPSKLTILSRDEVKQQDLRLHYRYEKARTDETAYRNFVELVTFRLGDVRSYRDVCLAMRDADMVIHAAALKQVPTCEYFPDQAVRTNCDGASNIVRAIAERYAAPQVVVGISTDKACKPINVMGMSKAMQERIFIAGNVVAPGTRFVGVRYGNVLASRGSVIPVFHEQIRRGGPVTITVPGMTRFLLTLDQAVDTVVEAIRHAAPGEILVPDAPAATVENIARALIGDRPVPVDIIGIRPGEKMHEILISDEECLHTVRRGAYYAILPMLPELQAAGAGVIKPARETEFSSCDTVMSFEETQAMLAQCRALVEDRVFDSGGDFLR